MKPIVTLGDASLFSDDLALLMPPHWLNDRLISFWCEHLRLSVLPKDAPVAILPPNVSFFVGLTNDPEDLEQISTAQALREKDLVVVTVNDARETAFHPGADAYGTHWSLLVFHRPENIVFYLDSIKSNPNLRISKVLASRLTTMVNAPSANFVIMNVPSQKNSYDCGAFVCVFAESVIKHFLQGKTLANIYSGEQHLPSEVVDITRQQIGIVASRLVDHSHQSSSQTKTI